MKNIIKAVVLFASVISFSSANAGVLEVTGTAKATYKIDSSDGANGINNSGKGIGITNELAFTGTGELDNGYTWKYQVELDDDAAGETRSDDTRLELTTPYGTAAFYNTEGSLSTKYSFSAAAYGVGSDNGAGGSMEYGQNIDAYNNMQYHTPAGLLPLGLTGKVAYAPSADSSKNSGNAAGSLDTSTNGNKVTQYQVTMAPTDALTIGASYLEKGGESGSLQGYEQGGYYGKYALGAFTIGAGKHFVANNLSASTNKATSDPLNTAALKATVKGFENTAFSLGYKVNDALSVSYEDEKSTAEKRTVVGATRADTDTSVDLKVRTLQAAYTMGGMTLSLSRKDLGNTDYVLNKANLCAQ
jgi:hypothetical protein